MTESVPGALVGTSPAVQAVYKRIALLAHTNVSVLILGEPGTETELAARAIHANGPRSDRSFVPYLDAAELTDRGEQLFGAVDAPRGLLSVAGGGTLFVGELESVPLAWQIQRLRVLERREVWPVGAAVSRPTDPRLIAAVGPDPGAAVRVARLHPGLFERLNIASLWLPTPGPGRGYLGSDRTLPITSLGWAPHARRDVRTSVAPVARERAGITRHLAPRVRPR